MFFEYFIKSGVRIGVHNVFFFEPAPPRLSKSIPHKAKAGSRMTVSGDTEFKAKGLCAQDKLVIKVKP